MFVLKADIDKGGMVEQDGVPTTGAKVRIVVLEGKHKAFMPVSDRDEDDRMDFSISTPVYRIKIIALFFEFKDVELDPSIGRIIPAPAKTTDPLNAPAENTRP